MAAAASVGLDQIEIGIFTLRILVQILHVRVRRRAVEVKVVFFYVFAVIGLAVRQAECALFENRVLAVPERHAKAQQLLVVADAGKTILTPVICAGPGHVMSEIVPGIPVLAVVFTYCSPLPLA